MTDPSLPLVRSEAEIYEELAGRLIAAAGGPALPATRPRDPLWLSAVRGRLLAVLASGLSLWGAVGPAYQALRHLWAEGASPEHAAAVLTQTTVALDSLDALLLASGAAVALAASAASKARSWWRQRRGA